MVNRISKLIRLVTHMAYHIIQLTKKLNNIHSQFQLVNKIKIKITNNNMVFLCVLEASCKKTEMVNCQQTHYFLRTWGSLTLLRTDQNNERLNELGHGYNKLILGQQC